MTEEQIRQIIREELDNLLNVNKFIVDRGIQILDGRNIQTGRTNGTKIATATDQKLAFYGTTPVIQGSAVSQPSGGATEDTEARTAINSIISRLQDLGLIA